MDMKIGCHLSTSKGYAHMAKEILSLGGNTFQFFTRNPRGGSAKPIDEKDIEEFHAIAKENGIEIILAHSPYTLNACSADESTRQFAIETFEDDPEIIEGQEQILDIGIDYIVDMLNKVLKPEQTTTVLLETMAGKGSEIGRRFEELQQIIERVELKEHIGVCLDTCHVYDAGYDIVNNLDGVLEEFDRIIGLDRLKAIHLNDSKNPFESHKDRHEKIGEGSVGLEAMERIINHEKLKHLPFYLETPNELDGYAHEIGLLKGLFQG